MDKKSLAHPTRPYTCELRALEERYHNELMDKEERLELRDWINWLKAQLGIGRLD